MSAIQQMMVGSSRGGTTLMSALTTAALTTNLKLCLDAGDSASYDPGVQTDKWLDRSGGGYDFYRGLGTGVEVQDPTFNGGAGALESYWGFDGGDYFTYDTTNEAWMETLHKNGAIFSAVMFYYSSGDAYLLGTDAFTGTGICINIDTAINVAVSNASTPVLEKSSDTELETGRWHMVGISITENGGASGGFFYADGDYSQVAASDTWNPNYTSPSAGAASNPMRVGLGIYAGKNDSGTRVSCLAVWQGTALTKANMDTIWSAMRGRFGI